MAQLFASLMFWNDSSRVHPDDFSNLTETQCPDGLCFICFEERGREGEYLILFIEGHTFRIKPEAIKNLPSPKFVKGQRVKTLNGTPRTGWIYAIGWFYKNKQHTYGLEIEGATVPRKKVKRSYQEDDLEAL